MTSSGPAAESRIREGRLDLRLQHTLGGLEVRTASGDLLDPVAADVLIALGGDVPAWLSIVEGLQAVDRWAGGDIAAVRRAASALARSDHNRARLARSLDDQAVLVALAASGQSQVAQNPAVTAVEWDLLCGHRDKRVRSRALGLATTLPAALADHPDPEARLRVGRNPSCPVAVLDRLSQDGDQEVRRAVAANPGTSPVRLNSLLKDKSTPDWVRLAVALNPRCPRLGLLRCLRVVNANIQTAAARNPALPSSWAAVLVMNRRSGIRRGLASRRSNTLRRLAWIDRCSRRDQPKWQLMIRAQLRFHVNAADKLKSRLAELDTFTRSNANAISSLQPHIPRARRVAAPSFLEAAVMVALAGGAVVAVIAQRPLYAIPAGLLELLVVPRCRTVRAGTRIAKSQWRVQADQRLAPVTQFRRMIRLMSALALIVVTAVYSAPPASQGGTPQGSAGGVPAITSGGLSLLDLHYAAVFERVAEDNARPLTEPQLQAALADARQLAALAHQDSTVLNTLDQHGTGTRDLSRLGAAYATLADDLTPAAGGTVSDWNKSEATVRSDLTAVATAETTFP
jgi:hypothetical protein